MELLVEHRQQDIVVDVVKAPLDVSLDEPADTSPVGGHVAQGGVAPPVGPKAVGAVGKLRLIVGFQNHPDDLLQQLIRPRRYAQGAGLAVSPNPPKDTDGRREDSGRGWVRELQGRWPGVLG